MHPLYEDNHLLVAHKECGLLTQTGEGPSLEDLVRAYLQKPFLEAVHRLDKVVSGVVVFAKTSKALSRMQEKIRAQEWSKLYLAIVEGTLQAPTGTMEDYLSHGDFHAFADKNGKLCSLNYRVLQEKNNLTLLALEPLTGRYHQLRAQLSLRSLPILGDTKYGSKKSFAPQAIALHHHRLTTSHPTLHTPLLFEAPLTPPWHSFFPT